MECGLVEMLLMDKSSPGPLASVLFRRRTLNNCERY